jgi:uroporphyrinogen-III decarboxylase
VSEGASLRAPERSEDAKGSEGTSLRVPERLRGSGRRIASGADGCTAPGARGVAAVIGLDWRISLVQARKRLGDDTPVQGNLDPAVLLTDKAQIKMQAQRVLDEAGGRPGHIFNLGHGVLPQTPVDNVKYLIEYVHEASKQL